MREGILVLRTWGSQKYDRRQKWPKLYQNVSNYKTAFIIKKKVQHLEEKTLVTSLTRLPPAVALHICKIIHFWNYGSEPWTLSYKEFELSIHFSSFSFSAFLTHDNICMRLWQQIYVKCVIQGKWQKNRSSVSWPAMWIGLVISD